MPKRSGCRRRRKVVSQLPVGVGFQNNFKKRMLPQKLALILALQQLAQHMYLCHPNHDAAAMTLTTLEVSTKSRIHDFLSKG